MDDYIALHTYDYKLSFCQATNELPGDMQRLVWEKLNAYESRDLVCPGAPQRSPEIHDSQKRDLKLWLTDGENSGANLLRERMNILAREQLYFDDYESSEYDSYSLVLYKLLLEDLTYQKRELQYSTIFGDKWRKSPTNKIDLTNIQISIHEVEQRCNNFKIKERKFKKKYFQDENYIIKGIDIE